MFYPVIPFDLIILSVMHQIEREVHFIFNVSITLGDKAKSTLMGDIFGYRVQIPLSGVALPNL